MKWDKIMEVFGLIGGIATVMALLIAPMFWLGSKIDSVSSELNQKIDSFRQEVHQENKDFHGRLIALETRRSIEEKK